jgi:hypothetical protein
MSSVRNTYSCTLSLATQKSNPNSVKNTRHDTDIQDKREGDYRSGKAMAGTGLRMMPTFPLPPLKFRTAGFPQYGFKAGISDSASIMKSLLCVRGDVLVSTSVRAVFALPQGPSLRSGLCCPSPSSLNRPHPPHSGAHPDFAALRLIPDALAVRFRLGDP